jgi:peptidoglycan/xylan/chitin deacetylase (PgdA/CDA1 family)
MKRILISIFLLALSACTFPNAVPTEAALASSSPSPFPPSGLLTATPSRTTEPIPTATQEPRAPAPKPDSFESDQLRPGIGPVSYIDDQCDYLQKRWDPQGSLPGTVVAAIMYHSVLPGNTAPTLSQDINAATFNAIVALARDLGFETITADQLLAFLQDNAKIPARSMILILDDRRPGTAEEYFLPLYEEYGWTTTLAWIIGDTDQRDGELAGETLWDWIERLNETGAFDVQSHGLNHVPITNGLDADFVREELSANIQILKQHFGQRPIAHIWAGGNYTALGVSVAEDAGYELGFTIHSRGPIQFNWIPQGEQERAASDNPLLLLPRFWDTAATVNLEQTAQIGDAAQEFARQNYAAEAAWFSQNCVGELPPLSEIFK